MGSRIVAIVGSYRKGGIIDQSVQAVLQAARAKGAETETFYLTDQHVEFCANCRQCTQEPGVERGLCPIDDDMHLMLDRIQAADAVVLGSPVNDFNVTAIFRRFLERLVGCAYWPWGQNAPAYRDKTPPRRKAVLIASAAMPGPLIPLATGAPRALRLAARQLGARPVGKLWIGLASHAPHPQLSARNLERARQLGIRLA